MNIATSFAFLLVGQEGGGPGPSAAPSDPAVFCYSGNTVGVSWTNNDSTASTQILRNGTVVVTVAPGVNTYETGLTDNDFNIYTWTARHVEHSQTSDSITFPSADCGGSGGAI